MEYSLLNVKTVWLTCEKSRDRWKGMELMLKSLELQNNPIIGEITSPYTIGVTKNHINAIRSVEKKDPILILEDDARLVNELPTTIFGLPDDCDALYLGTSLYGRIRGSTVIPGVISAVYNSNLLKIFNMLSLHAVLYITEKYKSHVIYLLENFLHNPIGGMDDKIAENMYKFNVYSLRKPMFFQNDGHSEQATKTEITPLLL